MIVKNKSAAGVQLSPAVAASFKRLGIEPQGPIRLIARVVRGVSQDVGLPFRSNKVRLQLFVLAYNLANYFRCLALPRAMKDGR